jgi:predicted esterase
MLNLSCLVSSIDSYIQTAGVGVRFEEYEGMGHSADVKELTHLTEWLKDVIPPLANV